MQAGPPTATCVIAMAKFADANLIVIDGNISYMYTPTRFAPNSNAHTYTEGIVADRHIVCLPNLAIQILRESTIHRRRWGVATASARLDGNVVVANTHVVVFNHHIPAAVWIDSIHIFLAPGGISSKGTDFMNSKLIMSQRRANGPTACSNMAVG